MAAWRSFQSAAGIIGFLLFWEVMVRAFAVPEYIMPAPSVILTSGLRNWSTLLWAAFYTSQAMIVGFLVAVVAGLVIAIAIAFSATGRALLYPLLVVLQIVPKIAVAPLFIIWFGFGMLPKVLLVWLMSFFPVVVAAMTAFSSIEPEVMELAKSTGAGRLRTFRMVQLPQALPALFGGIKVAAVLASTAAVVAEFVASDRGLGYLLMSYNGDLNTTMSFAAIIVLSVMGLALYGVVELVERISIPWHVSRRRAQGDVPTI